MNKEIGVVLLSLLASSAPITIVASGCSASIDSSTGNNSVGQPVGSDGSGGSTPSVSCSNGSGGLMEVACATVACSTSPTDTITTSMTEEG